MRIYFPRLDIPDHLKGMMREVVDGVLLTSLPTSWTGIMIYHPATNQYYATKSQNPMAYEEIVRTRQEPRWSALAISLRKMLEHSPDYQFFILAMQARPTIEQWMASQGKRRITTRMGEANSGERTLFQVYSPFNKVTRYVVSFVNTPTDEVIEKANASMAQWLGSKSQTHRHERETMRVALRSKFTTNTKIFEKESVVTDTHALYRHSDNEFRSVCMNMNFNAILTFIQNTTRGG